MTGVKTLLFVLLALLLCGPAAHAAAPQDILLVTNEPAADHPFEDLVVNALKILRQEQGTPLKIWTYRFRNAQERSWCENTLHIHTTDLPMLALVPAGQEAVRQVDHRVVDVKNPTLAAMGIFEAAVRSRNLDLKPMVSLVTQTYPQVESLVSKVPSGGRIAVGPISQADGQTSDLSYWMGERVESDMETLASQKHLTVVNRNDQAAMAKSWGLAPQDLAASAHQLMDLDYIVLGEYQRTDKDVSIHLRLVDAHQQSVLGTADMTVPRDDRIDSLVDSVKPVEVATTASNGPIKVWTDKTSYHVGDPMIVHVQTSQDVYLTLVDVGSSGKVTVLFPNFYHPDSHLKAGETYTIPSPDMGFDFEVGGPPGREFIRAIASAQPNLDVTSEQTLSADHPFSELKESPLSLTRDVNIKARKVGQVSDTVVRMEVDK